MAKTKTTTKDKNQLRQRQEEVNWWQSNKKRYKVIHRIADFDEIVIFWQTIIEPGTRVQSSELNGRHSVSWSTSAKWTTQRVGGSSTLIFLPGNWIKFDPDQCWSSFNATLKESPHVENGWFNLDQCCHNRQFWISVEHLEREATFQHISKLAKNREQKNCTFPHTPSLGAKRKKSK